MVKFYLSLILIITTKIYSQFYNGLQTNFGKSRIQYKNYIWQFYRTKRFDVYFPERGEHLAEYVAEKAEKYIPEIEEFLGTSLEKRIIFIVYHKYSDFIQSNIGLTSIYDDYNIGGTTPIINNKISLYFEGDHNKLNVQIRKAIAEVILNEALYGSELKTKISNTALLPSPKWFYDGLISFIAEGWHSDLEIFLRDGIINSYIKKISNISNYDATLIGHSFWFFICYKYGCKAIPNIIYLTRISKSIETAFIYTTGVSLKDLFNEWIEFLNENGLEDNLNKTFDKKIIFKTKVNEFITSFDYSEKNKMLAFATNRNGKIKVFITNPNNPKKKYKIFSQGYKIDRKHEKNYPIVKWHPSGKILLIYTEKKGSKFFYLYDLETKELTEKEIFFLDKVLDISYCDKGFNLLVSGYRNGINGIYKYSFASNKFEPIISDTSDYSSPRQTYDKSIVLISNRKDENDNTITNDYNLYLLNNKDYKLTSITSINNHTKFVTILPQNNFLFLNNSSGTYNIFLAKYDSTISFIDTAVHYKYFSKIFQITNNLYPSINYYCLSDDVLFYSTLKNKREYIIKEEFNIRNLEKNKITNPNISKFKLVYEKINEKKEKREVDIKDFSVLGEIPLTIDTSNIDYKNYVFNYEIIKHKQQSLLYDSISKKEEKLKLQPKFYMTNFYINKLVNQVDFGFLNNSYQQFTGEPFYYNPGLNFFIKVGAIDLLENYRITGGVKLSGDLNSNEYLLSFENLKDLIDKQIVFHRQSINRIEDEKFIVKTYANEIFLIFKYPISEIQFLRFTSGLRQDNNVYLALDIKSLFKENTQTFWKTFKLEYVFDNTFYKQINIYEGIRAKLFYEIYHTSKTLVNILGFDFRNYITIHRNFIFAFRIAGSTSFGNKYLLYYLGGIDNWINLSPKVPTFDNSNEINTSKNYAFQAIATNLRGFSQNIRNGTNFVLSNNELRFPIFKYFFYKPLKSDFLENFQIVSFFDIGTAWVGKSPYSRENAYNFQTIHQGPITIIIDKQREPIVWGYGIGLRTKILGYFIRVDYAWGIENNVIQKPILYLSLSLDF